MGAPFPLRRIACGVLLLAMVTTTSSRCLEPGRGIVGLGGGDSNARGLVFRSDAASEGLVLFSPLLSTTTYLIDRRGRVVHTWRSDRAPGASVYFLDSGHLLRCSREKARPIFRAGGEGGRIQEFTWDGELVWDFVLASPERVQHHDIEPLPNGNVLAIVWEHLSREDAVRLGREREHVPRGGVLLDAVYEIQPMPARGGRIVWEWHLRDHLIQEHDPECENYGVVADHPERVDINGDHRRLRFSDQVVERLRAIGYVSDDATPDDLRADLVHTNAVDFNSELDQIVLSAHRFDEIWVIDHGTTSRQASGRSGGRAGKGGDLLYRWGNPQVYGRGLAGDQQLFAHHDGRWIPAGLPGAGNILIFNNGFGRPGADYSSVVEIAPPIAGDGSYAIAPGSSFGPESPKWSYVAPDKHTFSADFISGAQRLANGNTFICSGPTGRFFEVTPDGKIVWEYLNPFTGDAPNPAGDPPHSVFRATFIPANHPGLAGRLQR
jgi:hypothetical protein